MATIYHEDVNLFDPVGVVRLPNDFDELPKDGQALAKESLQKITGCQRNEESDGKGKGNSAELLQNCDIWQKEWQRKDCSNFMTNWYYCGVAQPT